MQTTIKNNKKKSQNRTTNGTTFGAFPRLEEITARAYELYLARGAEAGHELDDWLQAEREIMEWV
jgi:hypothetical protein